MSNTTISRKFKGILGDFKSKEQRNFEKKHLRCYLRGDKFFEYGKNEAGFPNRFEVQQELVESKSIQQAS